MLVVQLSAAGGNLKVVHVNTNGNKASNGAPLLEFVVHNEAGQYDKAPEGSPGVLDPTSVIVVI